MKQSLLIKILRFSVLLSIFLIPFYFFRFSIGPIKTNIFEVTVLVSLFLAFNFKLSTKTKINFGSIWVKIFVFSAFLAIFFASDKVNAAGIFKGWFLAPYLLYLVVINLFTKKDLPKLSLSLYLSFAIVTIWGVLQSWHIVGLSFYQKNSDLAQYLASDNFRIFGPFESPNYLAMFLTATFFLVLPAFSLIKKEKSKIFYYSFLIPFGLAIYDIFLTKSRAGLIAFFVALIIFIFSVGKKRKRQNLRLPIFFLIFFMIFSYFYFKNISQDRGESNESRLQIYEYSVSMLKNNSVFGIGLGEFQTKITAMSSNDAKFQDETLSYALHPHNLYLAIWLNLGLIGLVSFCGLLIYFVKKIKLIGVNYITVCLVSSLVAVLIHGLFDTTYFKNDLSALFLLVFAYLEILIAQNKNATA